jgi:predicted RNA-binding protein with PIN domain
MPVIIDGHNLVPKIPGIELDNLDDEIQLIELLLEYCRIRRKQIEVYFDKAPQGHPRVQKHGSVTAFFARPGKTADDEIKGRLVRLERGARNWTVISSDGSIQTAARAARAEVITSEEFARELDMIVHSHSSLDKTQGQEELSEEELAMWLELFGGEQGNQKTRKRRS